MIVHNLDIKGMSIVPSETDAPLVVDANAVLSGASALQSLKPVSPNGSQVIQINGSMKPTKPFSRWRIARRPVGPMWRARS